MNEERKSSKRSWIIVLVVVLVIVLLLFVIDLDDLIDAFRQLKPEPLVLGSIVFFLIILATPLFQDLLRITWLSPLWNYLLVAAAAIVWALALRAIWRSGWVDSLYDKFIAHR